MYEYCLVSGCEDIDFNIIFCILALKFECFFFLFQKWTVIVDTAGHINHSNDFCPQWTETVEKINDYCLVDRSRCGRNDNCPWSTEVVDGQLSLLHSRLQKSLQKLGLG